MQAPWKYLIIAGIFLIVAGLIWQFFGDKLNWIGRLPGDIHVEKPGFKLYIPITTMILFSLLLTLISWIARRFF